MYNNTNIDFFFKIHFPLLTQFSTESYRMVSKVFAQKWVATFSKMYLTRKNTIFRACRIITDFILCKCFCHNYFVSLIFLIPTSIKINNYP